MASHRFFPARAASCAALLALAACASAGAPRPVTPAAIARLETTVRADPRRAEAMRALGIAYYQAQQLDTARRTLQRAAQLDPRDGTTTLYLGLAAEQQGDFAGARQAYAQYLRFGRTQRIRRQLEGRLTALTRKELEAAAKEAVRTEQTLAATTGSPLTIAVLPLRFAGIDSSLEPLGRGLAELLVTDLSRVGQLTVVERARMQALLDELALGQSGRVDSTTAVRAGRMLRAGRVVQGTIQQLRPDQLRVDAAVVDVPTTRAVGGATESNTVDQLFALEKQLALELIASLGAQLTPAERNAIEQRPTRSLAAFLAYSRGLAAEDNGQFEAASRHYQDAVRIDPAFGAAAQRQQQTSQATTALQVSPTALSSQVAGTTEGRVAEAAARGDTPSANDTAQQTANLLNDSQAGAATGTTSTSTEQQTTPPGNERAAEGTGHSNVSRPASATITLRIPLPK